MTHCVGEKQTKTGARAFLGLGKERGAQEEDSQMMAKAGGSAEYILAMGTSVPLFRMAPAFKGASSLCLLPFLFSSTGNSLNLCFTCSNLYPENNCEACAKVINVDHLSIAVYVKLSQNSCSI